MRIPLDYYRILGLPLAASIEQLRQAYDDRIIQMPRREYSHAAITSRKQLIEEAYVVLSDPKERKAYDSLYLAHAYAPEVGKNVAVAVEDRVAANNPNIDTQALSIEIDQEELVGALLILQELGEYEQVLKLGRPYLVNRNNAGNNGQLDSPSERPDIVLTVALACLELGREQWQQGHYENAAISLETGEELLAREGMFPSVSAEIQADLNRLRPYRILELIALSEDKVSERRQGLQLLQEILEERGGIDGSGNDQSGLSIDDFLRFIQQLRHYLTVAEQHKLFEAESKRPSAVATYLAVYALIARGFTQRQPALIRQAKQMLARLGKRQDVHLEQSLCALLLGQTEEATRALELSQEYEALAFIREHSKDSPDLLPGLCLYGERWLQNEVFPHFRDLVKTTASLKDYFADNQVQAYLEALPTIDDNAKGDWDGSRSNSNNPVSFNNRYNNSTTTTRPNNNNIPERPNQNRNEYSDYTPVNYTAATNGSTRNGHTKSVASVAGYQTIKRSESETFNGVDTSVPPPQPKRRKPQPSPNFEQTPDNRYRQVSRRRTRPPKRSSRLLLKVLASVAGVFLFWLLVSSAFGWLKNILTPAPALVGKQLSIQINEPPIKIPEADSSPQYPEGVLTKDTATEIVQAWLLAKSAALGSEHEIDSLNKVLSGSALSYWRGIALQVKSDNRYRKYEHNISDVSVETDEAKQNQATVEASVVENTVYYENSVVKKNEKDKVRVRYEFTRGEEGWRIRDISLLNKIN